MKRFYILLYFVIISSVLIAQEENDSPVIESRSKISFTETVDAIKTSAEEKGWKVLIVHNLQESLRKNGQEVLPVNIIEICKPEFSGGILKNDEPKSLSVFMPCRVSVYEKGDGNVYISRMNVSGLMSLFDEESASVMNDASGEIETLLKELIIY